MAAFLVSGNPGSGKASVARELTRQGFPALDTDYGIAGWETPAGVPVAQPGHATDEWLLRAGAVVLDGRRPTATVVDRILTEVRRVTP